MNNITELFGDVYLPEKALIIYRSANQSRGQVYVEVYDLDDSGKPVNAHPLDLDEGALLAQALDRSEELRRDFLTPKGLMPDAVLRICMNYDSYVMWHTPPQEVNVLFVNELTITCGKARIPALLWKATKQELSLYALKNVKKPTGKTPLYHAPFFNIHANGSVCMGTVDIAIDTRCFLEDFMLQWERYFFDSHFSHMMAGHNPVKCNMVELWQEQVTTRREFPSEVLIRANRTIKDLIG